MIVAPSTKSLKRTVSLRPIDPKDSIPVLQILVHKAFKLWPSLHEHLHLTKDDYVNEMFYHITFTRPSDGLSYLQRYVPKNPSIHAYIWKAMYNKTIDMLRANTSERRYITYEHQVSVQDEDNDLNYYDLVPTSENPISDLLIMEALEPLSKEPETDRHRSVYVEGVGDVIYSHYWVMYFYIIGYDIPWIQLSVLVAAVRNITVASEDLKVI